MIELADYLNSLGDDLAAFEQTEVLYRIGIAPAYRPVVYFRVEMTRVIVNMDDAIRPVYHCKVIAKNFEGVQAVYGQVVVLERSDAFRDCCINALAAVHSYLTQPLPESMVLTV